MIRIHFFITLFCFSLFFTTTSLAEENHQHESHRDNASDEHGHEETEEKSHQHADLSNEIHDDGHSQKKAKHSNHENHDHNHGEAKEDSHQHSDSEDEHGHGGHGESSFGKDKAITTIENDGKRFQLSSQSISFLKIKSVPFPKIPKNKRVRVKRDHLVEYQDKVGVFIQSGHWFELKEGTVIHDRTSDLVLEVRGLRASDQLVINRHGILRAAYLQATGQGGKGHAH